MVFVRVGCIFADIYIKKDIIMFRRMFRKYLKKRSVNEKDRLQLLLKLIECERGYCDKVERQYKRIIDLLSQ